MPLSLIVVESPAKAKKFQGFLKDGYIVKSSYGHFRDLDPSELSIDVDKNFEPSYTIMKDKFRVVNELRQSFKKCDELFIASDDDREGEAIGWHLCCALDVDPLRTKRIIFHEVTKKAIVKAIKDPIVLNMNLVNAQQARRMLDRLIGYKLSPVLWKHIPGSKSAGRVQSVVLRLIVENDNEISKFSKESYFKLSGIFTSIIKKSKKDKTITMNAECNDKMDTKEKTMELLKDCQKESYSIKSIGTKKSERNPSAPYTTSSLQQDAANKLGYSPKRTMEIAQKLYEGGYITYMRTDSLYLSKEALDKIKTQITDLFGEEYVRMKEYKTKSKGAQEAHEAIRPTKIDKITMNNEGGSLYRLIWQRTMMSQMSATKVDIMTIKIGMEKRKELFISKLENITFDGFLKVIAYYKELQDKETEQVMESDSDDKEKEDKNDLSIYKNLKKGTSVDYKEIKAEEKYTKPPPRYNEASLVKKLEALGIGRPSTFATMVTTVQTRGYVVKTDKEGTKVTMETLSIRSGKEDIKKKENSMTINKEKQKLFPTESGLKTNTFLLEHFDNMIEYSYTVNMEKDLDRIADEGYDWREMIGKYFNEFYPNVQKMMKENRDNEHTKLGQDKETDEDVYALVGKYGLVFKIGNDKRGCKFMPVPNYYKIKDLTIKIYEKLKKFPKIVGKKDGKEIKYCVGKFGPYLQWDGNNMSLFDKTLPSISEEEALEIIEKNKKRIEYKSKYKKKYEKKGEKESTKRDAKKVKKKSTFKKRDSEADEYKMDFII